MAQLEVARQVGGAVEQPDAADEVGAIAGRLAPPSQLIRVFGGQGAQTEDVPFASCPAIGDSNHEADDPICYPSSMAKGGKHEN